MAVAGAAPLPRLRAVVLDARERTEAGLSRVQPAPWPPVTTSTTEVRFARLPPRTTRDIVTAALGVDVIVIVAGPHVSAVARETRVLVAAGARAAVIAVPATTSSDAGEVERNARHLLTGAGLVGDDAAAAPLDAPDDDDGALPPHARLADAVARAASPLAHEGFVVVGRPLARGGAIDARAIAGRLSQRKSGSLLDVDRFEPRSVARAQGNDESFRLLIGPHGFGVDDDVVVVSEPLPCARRFVAQSPIPGAASREPCFAFGGSGGWASGTVNGVDVVLDRAVCPRDGRIGVVLFKGASLGPVHVVPVRFDAEAA